MAKRAASESDPNCAFCAIAKGEDQSVETVCQGEDWIAFFPLEPATPGHTLVIPKRHVSDLWDVPPELSSALMNAVIRVGHAIEEALRPDGMNLITSAGRVAEQTVFHVHLHLVPRWEDDDFGPIWTPEGETYSAERLQEAARLIRQACGEGGDAWPT